MFCKKCGSILKPTKENEKVVLVCPKCSYRSNEKLELMEKVKKKEEVAVVGEKEEVLPLIDEPCSKCGHSKAFFWTLQTRAADEPETRFYKCEKCGNTWREYG